MPDKFYTIAEICDLLQVTRQTVSQWIRTGELRSIKFGRLRRIPSESLRLFIEQKQLKTAEGNQ